MTWQRVCVLCARRNPPRHRELDAGHVCAGCRTSLRVDLAALVDAAAYAALVPHPLATRGTLGTRSAPGSRPPLDLGHVDPELVLVAPRGDRDAAQPLLVALEDWCRVVREDRGLVPYGVATEDRWVSLSTVVGFLTAHLDWMCETPSFAVEDFDDWVRRGLAALRGLDERTEHETAWTIPCPADRPEEDAR